MNKKDPFKFYKTSPEIIKLAVGVLRPFSSQLEAKLKTFCISEELFFNMKLIAIGGIISSFYLPRIQRKSQIIRLKFAIAY